MRWQMDLHAFSVACRRAHPFAVPHSLSAAPRNLLRARFPTGLCRSHSRFADASFLRVIMNAGKASRWAPIDISEHVRGLASSPAH